MWRILERTVQIDRRTFASKHEFVILFCMFCCLFIWRYTVVHIISGLTVTISKITFKTWGIHFTLMSSLYKGRLKCNACSFFHYTIFNRILTTYQNIHKRLRIPNLVLKIVSLLLNRGIHLWMKACVIAS